MLIAVELDPTCAWIVPPAFDLNAPHIFHPFFTLALGELFDELVGFTGF